MFNLDQDILTLTRCYSMTDQPKKTDLYVDENEPLAAAVMRFGAASRQKTYMPELQAYILQNLDRVDPQVIKVDELTELFWFLFSQKQWQRMKWLADISRDRLFELPVHIADLCFLSFLRLQGNLIMKGQGRQIFEVGAATEIDRIARSWPHALDRLKAFRAMTQHVIGNFDQAKHEFAALKGADYIEPFAGISSVLLEVGDKALEDTHLQISFSSCRHATVMSMDESYFAKYAELVARKYAMTNPRNGLHFHCVGFDPRDQVASWKLPVSIGFTIDTEPLDALTDRQQRGYFAGARYLHLSRYLEVYEVVFIADIDGHIAMDISDISGSHLDADIVITTKALDKNRELTRLPWEAIAAGSFMIRNNRAGKGFSRYLGAYLKEIFDRTIKTGQPMWYADQTALFYSWWASQGSIRFATFSRNAFIQRGSWQLFKGEQERLAFMSEF